jgi:glycosyltransferase involved in cell wall biosynthesis
MKFSVTIITINKNNKEGLVKTINSVLTQVDASFEYVIIDGKSDDGSVEILNEYSHKIDFWSSEPDIGIYNAMNKGIDKANGDYLLFLNSGDIFSEENSLKKVLGYLDGTDIIYGDKFIETEGKLILHYTPPEIDFNFFLGSSLPHPSTFIKSHLFDKFGKYNENFKIVSDWEFFLKVICIGNVSYKKVDLVISIFNTLGISSQAFSTEINQNERNNVLLKDYRSFLGMFYVNKFEKKRFPINLLNRLILKLYLYLNARNSK